MTAKVVVLQVKPGIQRDGTQFAAPTYVDGKWVRFQRNRPRKIKERIRKAAKRRAWVWSSRIAAIAAASFNPRSAQKSSQ